ncbi:alpha- and gamma-adaptin-binding protein p34-like [Anthonomus grandis grandis]|uniref:alpha- and gamma-adaptin-binding protein p34-like n=1 Tax=Anthonomus grandis grandis TaxID=2921223 RepID=UPI00216545EA|nr:alpha- and gamma-adaptin-binding protein p34-like [Anthonomus grandis grandis]
MNDLPSIVVVSSSNTKPKSLIKLISKANPTEDPSGVIKQPWKIDTKYYSSIVNLIGLNESYERSMEFNSKVEALIMHMDANKSTGLEDLKRWSGLMEDCDSQVKLLIANYCNDDTKISKNDVTEWCLEQRFEFVELYPSQTDNSEEQTIIPEKFGIDRVIEALQAHTWSNLVMKKSCKSAIRKADDFKADLPEDLLGEDDFTELFSQLHMMKDSLQSLSASQRKQCAEQMVTAFWQAIGGDDEELE